MTSSSFDSSKVVPCESTPLGRVSSGGPVPQAKKKSSRSFGHVVVKFLLVCIGVTVYTRLSSSASPSSVVDQSVVSKLVNNVNKNDNNIFPTVSLVASETKTHLQQVATPSTLSVHQNENLFGRTMDVTLEWKGDKGYFKIQFDCTAYLDWRDHARIPIQHIVNIKVVVPANKEYEVLLSIQKYANLSFNGLTHEATRKKNYVPLQTLDKLLKQLLTHTTRLIVHQNENAFSSTTSAIVEWVGDKGRFKVSLDKPSFFAWQDKAGVTIPHVVNTEVVVPDHKKVTVLNTLRKYANRTTRFSNKNELPLRTLDRLRQLS
mmetsp:Transcript_29977/g.33608  ORF Transcript_29977/g.33608 Transcript_29977/m.33608 type:complete len:318 (+) Transcript_29977:119-1072(+)